MQRRLRTFSVLTNRDWPAASSLHELLAPHCLVNGAETCLHEDLGKSSCGIQTPPPMRDSALRRYLSWDDYFMALAFLSAERSKDPNKQVSADRPVTLHDAAQADVLQPC